MVEDVKGWSQEKKVKVEELGRIHQILDRQRRLMASQVQYSGTTQASLDTIILRKWFVRMWEVGVLEGEVETTLEDLFKEWDAESDQEEDPEESSGAEAQLEGGDMDLTLKE